MSKPYKKPRRELRAMLPRTLLDKLAEDARNARRTISAQLVVMLEDRYGVEPDVMDVEA